MMGTTRKTIEISVFGQRASLSRQIKASTRHGDTQDDNRQVVLLPMRPFSTIRVVLALTALTLSTAIALSAPLYAQTRSVPPPRPGSFTSHPQQPTPPPNRQFRPAGPNMGASKAEGIHLNEWMRTHSNLPLDQQQKALENLDGFRNLPPQTQQHFRDLLGQLNAMPPDKRERLLDRNEWMEHLTVPQREQVRAATKQLAELPPDQRRYVALTFRGLRELPPAQRQAVLSSERFNHLTDAQRSSLNSLMQVEPLLPPPYDSQAGPIQ